MASAIDRNAVKNALLARLATATFAEPVNGFSTWAQPPSRRLKLFNKVDPSAQPACFLVQHREAYLQSGVGTLARRYLDMGVWCYAPTGDEGTIGDQYLDLMEAGIEATLTPDSPQRNELTLGGLVYWCRITRDDGLFVRDPGDIDGQALLVLPIRILLP